MKVICPLVDTTSDHFRSFTGAAPFEADERMEDRQSRSDRTAPGGGPVGTGRPDRAGGGEDGEASQDRAGPAVLARARRHGKIVCIEPVVRCSLSGFAEWRPWLDRVGR